MALNEGPSRQHTNPELNYQNWDDFHSSFDTKALFSIDVLLEDHTDSKKSTEHDLKPVTKNELPERIRINSDGIIQFLSNFHRSSRLEDGPIIMFRPYKTLFLFDEEIRHSVMELEKRADSASAEESELMPSTDDEDQVRLAHLRCLIRFMDTHLSARLKFLQSPECNAIFFSDLWLLYSPGDAVIGRDIQQAYRITSIEMKRRIVEVNGRLIVEDESIDIGYVHIDFDGKWLGPVGMKLEIKKWGELKRIGSLQMVPLEMAEAQKPNLRQDFIRRGQTFVHVAGIAPMNYSGYTLDRELEVNGTIVIDFEQALKQDNSFKGWRKSVLNYGKARIFSKGCDERDDREALAFASKHGQPHDDSYVDDEMHRKFLSSQHAIDKHGDEIPSMTVLARLLDEADPITEDELLIMSHRVFGYTMDTGVWGKFPITLVVISSLTLRVPWKMCSIYSMPHYWRTNQASTLMI